MNQARRKTIKGIQTELGLAKMKVEALLDLKDDHDALRAALDAVGDAGLEDIANSIDDPKDEEQEYYDNMPEGLQGSEKGENAEAAVSAMEEAAEKIGDAKDAMNELTAKDFNLDDLEDKVGEVTEAIEEADGQLDEAQN